ncbi:MAG TPA: ATP-binding cassette domain-containing protein [Steroidobacteraceae bacterium]|nr:ATP-binding cassette domain-containing protein [Steroidobacteraceae bacterium]
MRVSPQYVAPAPSARRPAASEPCIELIDVEYHLEGRAIFSGLSLMIPRGCIASVMGPSGTGKTTLLRLMTGQVRPDRGHVRVEGQDVPTLPPAALYALRLRMGVLFQQGALFTDLDVFENVAFPARAHANLPEELLRILVLTKLHSVGLRGAANLMPFELSGGMARRVALARALVLDPSILFCDEPFTGLDPISIGVVIRLLRAMNEALGITIIVVSHDIPEAEALAHRHFILLDGRVAASGTPAEIRAHPSALVRQFMAGSADGPVPFHYPAVDYTRQLLGLEDSSRAS